eukprot:TRINITY_DN81716_c0_g1_i1.p1 TRINITY_DN81716_c0_g1~~TRINITY_DN81716_c0_g1_i1.p1  ORF type:complete len:377 (+),score=41.45 TRINITY_DN81716_c0_g1_i1:80-1210(+)
MMTACRCALLCVLLLRHGVAEFLRRPLSEAGYLGWLQNGTHDANLGTPWRQSSAAGKATSFHLESTALRSLSGDAAGGDAERGNATDNWLWTKHSNFLLICNAYALQKGLTVFARAPARPGASSEVKRLTGETMPYKHCERLEVPVLGPGSMLDFRASTSEEGPLVGTFYLQGGMPRGAAVLLLVVFRHDPYTSVAEFASHVFDHTHDPQVAVIDAYRGKEPLPVGHPGARPYGNAGLEVRPGFQWNRRELLHGEQQASDVAWHLARFDSELSLPAHPLPTGSGAVPTGSWEFRLPGSDPMGHILELWPETGHKYVAIRVGVDAIEGPHYPQELIILPKGTAIWRSARGAASRSSLCWAALTWCLLSSVIASKLGQ